MQRAGFEKNAAGGLLAAGGLGAIISPPVLGAAAFLIAEFLKISYLDVIWMATIPTCLYYLSLLFMVELDAKRFGAQPWTSGRIDALADDAALRLSLRLARLDHHFHVVGLLPDAVGFLVDGADLRAELPHPRDRDHAEEAGARVVRRLDQRAHCCNHLRDGRHHRRRRHLDWAGTEVLVDRDRLCGGSLLLTAIYTALIVWIVGLAVPVTASYIICAVIAAPAMIKLGVPDYAAHMFIFYYSVLSEVSPPTALSPFAAAAITGGDPYKTTLQAWKYTLPAFLVPLCSCSIRKASACCSSFRRTAPGSTSS